MMNTIFTHFNSKLTKFKAKVTENNVSQLFSLEYRSPYDIQTFLSDIGVIPNYSVMQYFGDQVFWSSLAIEVSCDISIEFDEVPEFPCKLNGIKVRKKYSAKDMSDVYTYELMFEKEVDSDLDALLVFFMNQTEEDENGHKHLIDYCTELKYIPPIQTDIFDPSEEVDE